MTKMNNLMTQIISLEKQYPIAIPSIYQLLSCFCFALHTFSVKYFQGIPATQIIVWRSILTLIIIQALTLLFPCNSYPQQFSTIKKLIGRGFFGGIGFISFFLSIKLSPLSEAVVLQRTNPLWTTLLVVYVYKTQKLTLKIIFEIISCLLGVVLITKPEILFSFLTNSESKQNERDFLQFFGLLLALLCAFTTSITQVLIKSLSKEAHQLVILQYFSIFGIVMAVIYQLYSPFEQFRFVTFKEGYQLLLSGFFGCFAQIFMNRAMMIGNITQMSLVGQSQIVFNILLDIIILKTSLGIISWIGILLIGISLISNIYKNDNKKNEINNNIQK